MTDEGKCPHAQRRAQKEEQSPQAGEDTKAVGTERGEWTRGSDQNQSHETGTERHQRRNGELKNRGQMHGGASSLTFPNPNRGAPEGKNRYLQNLVFLFTI